MKSEILLIALVLILVFGKHSIDGNSTLSYSNAYDLLTNESENIQTSSGEIKSSTNDLSITLNYSVPTPQTTPHLESTKSTNTSKKYNPSVPSTTPIIDSNTEQDSSELSLNDSTERTPSPESTIIADTSVEFTSSDPFTTSNTESNTEQNSSYFAETTTQNSTSTESTDITTENVSTTESITEQTTTETTVVTTDAPIDCNLRNATQMLDEETNILTIFWETNGSGLCNENTFVTINLTNKNCVEKCKNESCSCDQNIKHGVNKLNYTFVNPLIPCATYFRQIQIINSPAASEEFNLTFDAYRKYANIENFAITDEEDTNDKKILNMVVTWDYKYNECNENFVVSARGQGNNYESSIQGNSLKFLKVEACEQFNIIIHIKDQPNINASSTHTMKRVNPTEIRNLTANQVDKTSIRIAWEAPLYGEKCIHRYMIHAKNEFEESIQNTSDTSYMLLGVYACVDYTITLSTSSSIVDDVNQTTTTTSTTYESTTSYFRTTTFSVSPAKEAKQENSESSRTVNIKTEPKPFGQPQQPQLESQTDKALILRVVPTSEPDNMCPIYQYHVECTSISNSDKIKSGVNTTSLVEVDNLDPFHNYSCIASVENENRDKSIWSYNGTFMTKEGVPNAPQVKIAQGTLNATSFIIQWEKPTSPKGIIKQYYVYINFIKFTYDNPSYCAQTVAGRNETHQDLEILEYNFTKAEPSSTFSVQVRATNQGVDGEFSSPVSVTTKAGPPDKLRNFIINPNTIDVNKPYNRNISIEFDYPCHANGEIQEFVIEFRSNETFNKTIPYEKNILEERKYNYNILIDELKPDIEYIISGYANAIDDIKGEIHYEKFKLTPGIPESSNIIDNIVSDASTTSVYIRIPESLFISGVGKINYAKILIAEWNCPGMVQDKGLVENDRQSRNISIWEEAMNHDCIPVYDTGIRIDNGGEKPQKEGIGIEQHCETGSICNGRLRPGTTYGLTFRLYTDTGYADTNYIMIVTNKEVPIIAISIIILSILCLVFLIGFYISCRRTQALRKSALDSPYDRKDISIQNFASYHVIMAKNDNEKIKEEYKAIQYFSDTLDRTYIASRANEKLNRYINIYPFDSSRVVLNDDELENDYINASYINGYYYPKEYIAAQGPKPDTVLDFWRMVIQHQVESIVMLTSLVESNKVKCHEYFPRLNGTLTSGNIKITCVKEQNHLSYIKRVLNIEKNDLKLSVNHYYFCKWPDHGCPSSALDLIEFVKVVRNERQKPGETFVVHCSAGVGRTGTFIALDIMMQRIKKESKINIFDLVKQLRTQRMKMVQSCDQYIFLYVAALELINMSRRTNVVQNLRDTVLKYVNEISESWKCRESRSNERTTIVKVDEKETAM